MQRCEVCSANHGVHLEPNAILTIRVLGRISPVGQASDDGSAARTDPSTEYSLQEDDFARPLFWDKKLRGAVVLASAMILIPSYTKAITWVKALTS